MFSLVVNSSSSHSPLGIQALTAEEVSSAILCAIYALVDAVP